MPKIFACLAVSNVLVLAGTAVLGIVVEGRQIERHMLLAVFTLIVTCFVQAVFFTYFAVSGKLVTQAVSLGRMDPEPVTLAKGLKRDASAWLALVMGAALAGGGTGAARWGGYLSPATHLGVAFGAIVVTAWAFVRQYDLVFRGAHLTAQTLRDYEAVRSRMQEHGT